MSGTEGKIWEKLQENGEGEAGFHIQGKTSNSSISRLHSRWENDSFWEGGIPKISCFRLYLDDFQLENWEKTLEMPSGMRKRFGRESGNLGILEWFGPDGSRNPIPFQGHGLLPSSQVIPTIPGMRRLRIPWNCRIIPRESRLPVPPLYPTFQDWNLVPPGWNSQRFASNSQIVGIFPVFSWLDEAIIKFPDSGNCRGRNGSGGKIPAPTLPDFQTFHWRIFFWEPIPIQQGKIREKSWKIPRAGIQASRALGARRGRSKSMDPPLLLPGSSKWIH